MDGRMEEVRTYNGVFFSLFFRFGSKISERNFGRRTTNSPGTERIRNWQPLLIRDLLQCWTTLPLLTVASLAVISCTWKAESQTRRTTISSPILTCPGMIILRQVSINTTIKWDSSSKCTQTQCRTDKERHFTAATDGRTMPCGEKSFNACFEDKQLRQ